MSYANFDTSIVQVYKCKIIGWRGKFVNPSEIGSIEELRTLRDAWACGTACWVRLTAVQVKEHMEEYEEKLGRGEAVAKVRKQRSDAGTSRGGKRKASSKENAQPARRAKRARTQLPPKSKATISDEEEEEEEEGEEEE